MGILVLASLFSDLSVNSLALSNFAYEPLVLCSTSMESGPSLEVA